MIQSSFVDNRSVFFKILSDDQIFEIRRAAFDVLLHTGCKIHNAEARKMLIQAGAIVKDELVKIPEHIIEACINTAPKGFTIYDRDGNRAMEVEGLKSFYGSSTGSLFTKDSITGEVHKTLLKDIERGARISDALENIDFVMPMGSASDIDPHQAEELYEFEAILNNTTKPSVMLSYSIIAYEMVYEMAAEVAGGLDNLREKPFIIFYPEPITPLVFPSDVIDRMFISADLCMPQIPGPVVQIGVTGPVTLAGGVTQLIAEALMSVILIQLRKPGAPCFMGASFAGFDMATGNICLGSPELSLGIIALNEVEKSFGLPTWGTAGGTDAKTLDAQAGVDGTFSILSQGLGGVNLIHDVGYMDNSMICSAEMLVLGNEIIGKTKRFIRGFEVNPETIARELINKVGPGGNYLQEEHTLNNFRKELWMPSLLTRQRFNEWKSAGAKTMERRVREKIVNILENHEVPSLPDKVLEGIEKIKRKADGQYATK